jgi:hypothetical protein
MQTLDIIREQLEMLAMTSQPESSQMRLGSEEPQSNKSTPVLSPNVVTDSTPMQDAQAVEPVRFYPCISCLIFSRWVEVKATLLTRKLELLTLELHPPTRSWDSMNPPARI